MLSWYNSTDCDFFTGCSGYTKYQKAEPGAEPWAGDDHRIPG